MNSMSVAENHRRKDAAEPACMCDGMGAWRDPECPEHGQVAS